MRRLMRQSSASLTLSMSVSSKMMESVGNRYLYVFGYEDPFDRRSNSEHGTDFESSSLVWIIADNEEQALNWGYEISEWFVKLLHEDINISWKKDGFAAWIEYRTEELLQAKLAEILEVQCGAYPNFNPV
jgi:hypothetical protein